MAGRPLSNQQLLTMLAAAPARIAGLTAGLAPALLQESLAPDQWSANQVLAHLRACADMWGDCISAIIVHDHPTLRAINPRTWIDKTDYREQAFEPSLQVYTNQRAALVATLEPLAPEDWARVATVTGAGKPLELTVRSYAERLAVHERPHLKQIERIVRGSPR
jgi:hypothetical protein